MAEADRLDADDHPTDDDLAELAERSTEQTARQHLDRSATLGLAELVEHQAAFYRAWPTEAGAVIAEALDELAAKIQATDARTPDEYRAQIGVLEDAARERRLSGWLGGWSRGVPTEARPGTLGRLRRTPALGGLRGEAGPGMSNAPRPAMPRRGLVAADQPQIRLVDQGGGLERLPQLLGRQPLRRQLAQFVVHERQELLGGAGIAVLNIREDARDVVHAGQFTALETTRLSWRRRKLCPLRSESQGDRSRSPYGDETERNGP
jgi:hypothetical protein